MALLMSYIIIATHAGKDLISSLVSGLLTIGIGSEERYDHKYEKQLNKFEEVSRNGRAKKYTQTG